MIQLLAVRPPGAVPAGPSDADPNGRDDATRALVEARARAMHPAGSGRVRRFEPVEEP